MTRLATLQAYKGTNKSVGQTREDIERLLAKWDCAAFQWNSIGQNESLQFVLPRPEGGHVAIRIDLPIREDMSRAQMMRVMHWYLKSKLEAVEVGMADLEQEFLPLMLVGKGQTAYETLRDQIELATSGVSPLALLPGAEER